nr:class I SAM-dependent methyltransferase [uncultured Blautia sp.]
MQLSLRLSAIAEMVTEGNRLVDVGCDHGYLPVNLIQKQKIPSAIAADVGKGPLSRAQEHIEQYGLGKYIETRLSDGLREIREGEGDTLVIAGMGGPLMERILTDGKEVLRSFKELILQPQSDIGHVRRFLFANGYQIMEENSVLEDGKFYFIMKAAAGIKVPVWKDEELEFGKLLLEKKHPVLRQYLERELRIRDQILERLRDESREAAVRRKEEVMEERRLILAALERYEG